MNYLKFLSGMLAALAFVISMPFTLNAAPPTTSKLPASGVFYLCGDEGDAADQHFSNSVCSGVSFRASWAKVEASEGFYDWGSIDKMIAAAKVAHKAVGVGVAAGIRSPGWLGSSGAQMVTRTLVRSFTKEQQSSLPVIWDSVYQEKWGAFLMEFGKRYDNSPNLAYVTMAGMGPAFEPFAAKRRPDVEKFQQMGGLPKWIEGCEAIIDLYAKAFPHTPFIFAMNRPIPDPDSDAALASVVDYGLKTYPGRFGIMFHGLSAETSASDYYGKAIQDNTASTVVGFQMVSGTKAPTPQWLAGTLDQCLDNAVTLKAHFVEVYGADCDDSAFTALLTSINQKLKAN